MTPKNEENWANFGSGANKDEEMSPVKTAGRFDVSAVDDVSTPPRSPKASPVSSPQKSQDENIKYALIIHCLHVVNNLVNGLFTFLGPSLWLRCNETTWRTPFE